VESVEAVPFHLDTGAAHHTKKGQDAPIDARSAALLLERLLDSSYRIGYAE
jgi:hypothetical protein